MSEQTPRSGLPLLAAAQAQKHVTHNEALYQLDAFIGARILDRDLAAPPASPADGDTYLVAASASGAWTGQDGNLAYCADGSWRFYAPFAGLVLYVTDEQTLIAWSGSAWVSYGALIAMQNLPLLGVNTMADATNKFSARSNAVLFAALDAASGGTGDIRFTVNKSAAANTASLLFQDNWSGRAEMGLAGDDDFHFKVSADGSNWREALRIASADGALTLPQGRLAFPATQNPSADSHTLDDYVEGSWTPVLMGSTTAGTQSYTTQLGSFTKIGRLVSFYGRITLSATSGMAGVAQITGLPFPTLSNQYWPLSIGYCGGVTLSAGYSQLLGYINQVNGTIFLAELGSGALARQFPAGGIDSTFDLAFSASYQTV